jgi:recombination DNA repair RAD52 pathway protein
MGFSEKQVQALRRRLDADKIRTRHEHGRELSYIDGIRLQRPTFGFDGWSRETVESRCVSAREIKGYYVAVYLGSGPSLGDGRWPDRLREGHGTGEGRGLSPGDCHDVALKAAETDATKRALATFGSPFGLKLYHGNGAVGRTSARPIPPATRQHGRPPQKPTPTNPSRSARS